MELPKSTDLDDYIKPSNIMYDPESHTFKLAGFGIVRITDSGETRTGTVLGTPNCMSPEQCMGKKVEGRADLFSPGVVLYQLCLDDLPFKGESVATLVYSIVNDPPTDLVRDTDIESTIRKLGGSLGDTASHLVNVANASGGRIIFR